MKSFNSILVSMIAVFALAGCQLEEIVGEKQYGSEWDYAYEKWEVCPHRKMVRSSYNHASTSVPTPGEPSQVISVVSSASSYNDKVTFRLHQLSDGKFPVLKDVKYKQDDYIYDSDITLTCRQTKPGSATESREYECQAPRDRLKDRSFFLESFELQHEDEAAAGRTGASARYKKEYLFPPCALLQRYHGDEIGPQRVWLDRTEAPVLSDW